VKKKRKRAPRKRRYLWGILHGGNALALCAGAGVLLGTLLAVVLGILFGSGTGPDMGFEMGIYIFAGVVLGTAIGGGIGYVLSSILPNASSESVSEQLTGGLFRVIGGFMITGIGIVSFGVFDGMEANGIAPGRMFAIALLLYELVGKWGVLVIIGGAGVSMIVFGIRAMIPKDS
jgi:hypothetical protein